MSKRGPYYRRKPQMTFREIGTRLHTPMRTVASDYYRAMRKLALIPGAMELLLAAVMANGESYEPLQARSLECRKELRMMFAYGDGE